MTRKCALRPESLAIVEQLKKHGPSTVQPLLAHLPGEKKADLTRRLANLVAGGWLDFDWDSGGNKHWFVRPAARAAVAAAVPAQPVVPNLVPPPTHNVMAGTYTPRTFAPARSGALDFASVASRGHSC